ncbi:subtilisin-like protein [Lactarius deliciosus]|nr:subtilisin-like protein [Lactarius deliciosus]
MRYCWVPVLSLLSCTVTLSGIATSHWDNMRPKHSWKTIPEDWECLGLPTPGTLIDLYVALKPNRKNALVDALNEVSDPGHPRHVSSTCLRYACSHVCHYSDTVQLVHSWLEHHRLTSSVSVTHGGSFLTVTGVSVSQANDLLGASYQFYTNTETNETIIRTLGYSLPVVLDGHVQTVAPTTFFSSPLTQWLIPLKRSDVAAGGPGKSPSGGPVTMPLNRRTTDVTPAFLHWLYSTFAYVPSTMDRSVVGVTGYSGEYPNPADLNLYMSKYRPDGTDATCAVALDYLPQTISTSYGAIERLYPMEYATQLCLLFAQLGARGASVLFASGDYGVGEGNCRTNDGTVRFAPLFPATWGLAFSLLAGSPYVTAVGGMTNFMPEVAADLSGGGFSELFLRPTYQQQAVPTFLNALGGQYSGLHRYRRAGDDNPVFPQRTRDVRERNRLLNTSASVLPLSSLHRPSSSVTLTAKVQIVAGIISLLNDYGLSQGKHPLGFLNPWLYDGSLRGFNDIVSGSNPGCNTDGFSTIVGWDPVTGLGTPDFEQLLYITYLIWVLKTRQNN